MASKCPSFKTLTQLCSVPGVTLKTSKNLLNPVNIWFGKNKITNSTVIDLKNNKFWKLEGIDLVYGKGSCPLLLLYVSSFPVNIWQQGNRSQWVKFHGSTQSMLHPCQGSSPNHLSQNLSPLYHKVPVYISEKNTVTRNSTYIFHFCYQTKFSYDYDFYSVKFICKSNVNFKQCHLIHVLIKKKLINKVRKILK